MPVEPWIPLAGVGPRFMSPGEQLHLMEYAKAMQKQRAIQQIQASPGMVNQEGIYTDQGLIALGQIDPAMRDQAVMHKATILAQRSLQQERDMTAMRKNMEETQEIAKESKKAGYAAWRSTQGPEEVRKAAAVKARNDYLQARVDSGVGAKLGWKDPDIQKAMGAPFSPMDTLFDILPTGEAIERTAEMDVGGKDEPKKPDAVEAKQPDGNTPLSEIGKPTDVTTDTKSGAQVRPMTQEAPIQTKEIGENEPDPVAEQKIEADAKPETPDSMRKQAQDEETRAKDLRKQGAIKTADKADQKAKELRSGSVALEQRIQKETDQELAAKREQRIAASREGADIRPEDAEFVAKQVWAGDKTAMQGWARNQKSKAQIQRAITDYGHKIGKTAEELTAKQAEFKGIEQAERTLGARAGAVELGISTIEKFAPLVEKASAELKRTNVRSLNDLYEYALSKTASPELRNLSAQINGFINIYARTVGGGVPHVDDKVHAREVLDRGFSHGDIMAAVKGLVAEMQAEKAAVPEARHRITEGVRGGVEADESMPPDSKGEKFKGWTIKKVQ